MKRQDELGKGNKEAYAIRGSRVINVLNDFRELMNNTLTNEVVLEDVRKLGDGGLCNCDRSCLDIAVVRVTQETSDKCRKR